MMLAAGGKRTDGVSVLCVFLMLVLLAETAWLTLMLMMVLVFASLRPGASPIDRNKSFPDVSIHP